METSYDVRVWKIRAYKGRRGTTYRVRWLVRGEDKSDTYPTFALADAFRSELVAAARRGEAFSTETGLPISHKARSATKTWYDFALEFVDMKWPGGSANNRKNIAKALVPVTVTLLRSQPNGFDAKDVRTALREWAFNRDKRAHAPEEVEAILRWVERNSRLMSAWETSGTVRDVVDAISTKLDGKPAAASTVQRYRGILHNALEYAVQSEVLRANPMKDVKIRVPKTSSTVDKRSVVNPEQAAALLRWVRDRPRGGPRLYAFFATLYYAGLRPEEAVALRVRDLTLPEQGWGEILVHTATPEVGRQWTDSGKVHDERHLKGRAAGDTRPVPAHPVLVGILRAHIATEKLKQGDRVFSGESGGVLAGVVYRRAWDRAREKTLTPDEYASPLARRVYDLRHTCLTTWLNSGVPPAQVAAWAGNSVAVLLATYARCISGHDADLKKRIEAVLKIGGPGE